MYMHDPYLHALFHGEIARKNKKITPQAQPEKNKFDQAIENHIDQYIDSLNLELKFHDNPLINPETKKAQLRDELKSSFVMPEFEKLLSEAFNVLLASHYNYLSPEQCRQMEQEFLEMNQEIEKIDLNEADENNFQTLFKISDGVMDGILTMGIVKYQEQEYPCALAIFTLLTCFNPENEDYWYRLGISAQKSEDYQLALKAYDTVLETSPELLGALIFSAECHLRLNQKESAQHYFIKAKEVASTQKLEEIWKVLLSKIEEAI